MNKLNKIILLSVILMMNHLFLFADGTLGVEMAERLRADGRIYAVVAVLAIIFVGIASYLLYIDSKVRKLEKNNFK